MGTSKNFEYQSLVRFSTASTLSSAACELRHGGLNHGPTFHFRNDRIIIQVVRRLQRFVRLFRQALREKSKPVPRVKQNLQDIFHVVAGGL
jgi:hypothetical protein